MQDLQAQLCSEQEAAAKKEAELQAVQRQVDELEAQLAKAQNAAPDIQPRDSQGSEPPLMLPAPSDPQVCPMPWMPADIHHAASSSTRILKACSADCNVLTMSEHGILPPCDNSPYERGSGRQ